MPQAIAGALFATGTIGYAVTYALVTMAINYGLSALSASMAGKKNQSRAGPGRDVTVRGTTEPMQMIYGEVRTPGFIAYIGTSGNRNEFLHYVVVWAAHQCEGIGGIWVDSVSATVSAIDGSMTGDGIYPPGGPAVAYAWHHLGEKNQAADSTLVSAIPEWDSDCRGAGLCYTHFRLEYHEGVFANGAPQNFFAYVKGRRLYDPRKDSTNGGSGSHRRDDATTWEHSNNWALCVRDYITGGSRWYDVATPEKRLGFGESDSRIDDSYVISQANICDELVPIPGGSQARYTCDVQLSCGDTFKENLEILKTAAAGNVTYVNGRYRIYAGAYEAPTVALGPDDFVGPVQVTTHPRKEDVYNMVTGVFYNEDADWQLSTFPNIRNQSYEIEDRGQRVRKIELPATRSSYRAQRIAILHLAQSRNKIRISASKLSPKALRIAQWQTFSVTLPEFGWDNKVFRCMNWEWDPTSGYPSIVAREESPSAYVDPDVDTYAEPHESTVDTPAYDLPATPINFSVTPRIDGLLFQWEVPAPVNTNQTYHLYEYTSDEPFSSATRIWSGKATSVEVPLEYGTTRYYWVTAELNGVESEETPVGKGIEGQSLPPPADGQDGAPGVDALTMSMTPTAKAIACSFIGVPNDGELPIEVSVTVFSGATDVTNTSSYTHTSSGCTVTDLGNGQYEITTVFENSGYLQVTATYGSTAVTQRMTWTKIMAGSPAASVRDTSLTINSSSSYSGTQGGPLALTVGPGGTIRMQVIHNYYAVSFDGRIAGSLQYRTTPGVGAWTTVGAEVDGTQATAGPGGSGGALSITRTLPGPGSPETWEFQYINRTSSGATPGSGNGTFSVSYEP